jgi:hypothetical protein
MRRFATSFKENEAAKVRRLVLYDADGKPLLRDAVMVGD